MKQSLAANYHLVPNQLSGSGTASQIDKIYAEQGIIYMAIYAYAIFGKFVDLINILILIRVLFTILSIVVIYLFTMELTDDKFAGVLAGGIYAISSIGLGVEAFSIWKGEGFVPILIITGVLLILYAIKDKNKIKSYSLFILSGLALIFAFLVWNGGAYALAAAFFVCLALILARYIKSKKALLACIGIIILLATIGLFASGLHKAFALVPLQVQPEPYINISVKQGIILNTMQVIGQVQPVYPQINVFYLTFLSNKSLLLKLPYLMWIMVGFTTTTLLAIITIIKYQFNKDKNRRNAFVVLITLTLLGLPLALIASSWWTLLISIPIAILAGASYTYIKQNKLFVMLVISFLLASFVLTMWQTKAFNLGPVPQFTQATTWIQNNTPINAKFITMPGDGSALEYLANRTSYIDTDTSSDPEAIAQVAHFFFAKAYNFTFLQQVNYNYVLVEQDWSTPAGSGYIALDGNFPADKSVNGTNLLLLAPGGSWNSGGLNNSYSDNGITLKEVYNDNGIIIYEVTKQKGIT
jgi:hypothetical protein